MVYHGRVRDGTIVLDPGIELPDGSSGCAADGFFGAPDVCREAKVASLAWSRGEEDHIAPEEARQATAEIGLPEGMSLDAWEQELIKNALKQANGNKSQAARILGLTRNALRYRLTQMGIES